MYSISVLPSLSRLIYPSLCLLRRLCPELHQQIHQDVRAEHHQDHNPGISPAVIVLIEIQRAEVVLRFRVRAHLAPGRIVRVLQMAARSRSFREVARQVLAARLTVGRVKETKFTLRTLDVLSPEAEYQEATHKVVERVQVVHPVPPECLDLLVGNQDTTE